MTDLSSTGRLTGHLGFVGTLGQCVGFQAPTAAAIVVPVAIAAMVGTAAPLAFLLGIAIGLIVALAFCLFARKYATSGSVYGFNRTALGAEYGFASGAILICAYMAAAVGMGPITTLFLNTLWPAYGDAVPWPITSLGLIAIAGVLTYRSVSLSANFSAAVSFVGIVCLAVIGVAIIAQGGANGDSVTLEPFTTGGVPFSTVAFGVAFAFVGFAGFESAAVLGEEADNPTRAIPRAIIMGLVISGVVVTFSTYVQVIGFPDVTSLITDVSPLQTLSAEYVGGSVTGKILTAAGLLSSFGALVSSINATGRMIFSFARDGIVPQKLAYTHPRHGTPVAAFAVVLVISAVATLCFMGSTPIEVFTDLSHTGSVAILVTYLMTIVAAMVRFRSPVTMSILAVGVPAIAYVLYRQLWPVAAYPAKFFIWAGVAWVLLVVIWVLVSPPLRARLATAETLELYENPGEAHVGRATDAPTESPV